MYQSYKLIVLMKIINYENNLILNFEGGKNTIMPEPTMPEKILQLENRRYIGNKTKLVDWILKTIIQEVDNTASSFLDIFAGTASVAKSGAKHFSKIMVNDILSSNNVIYKAFFDTSPFNREKIAAMLSKYNSINTFDLPENYFSAHFGNKFFDKENAKLIGYIRDDIASLRTSLSEKEYCILLATLIYNIDKIANTVGHFDAYIKKEIKYKKLILHNIAQTPIEGIEIYNENANLLVRKIKADVVYIDPPYNSRQYNRFYHIYENIVEWQKPPLFGVALKPKSENNSLYCTTKAKIAFQDLIKNLDAKYLAVSYNNTYNSKSSSSENKIRLEEIAAILREKGETKIFECSHKFFNTGKTDFNDHKELLYICKVKSS